MNAGKDYVRALAQAQANADLTQTPRWMHLWEGVWWINKTKPIHAETEARKVVPHGPVCNS